jgi:outer membrane protein assembly factor BamA
VYKFIELPSYLIIPSIKQTDQFGWMLGPGFVAFNLFGEDLRAETFLRSSLDLEAQQYLLSISSPWLANYPIDYGFDFIRGLSQDNQRGYFDNSYRTSFYAYFPVKGIVEVYGDIGFAAIEVQDSVLKKDPLFFNAFEGWDYSDWLGGGLRLDGRNAKMYTSQGYMLEFGMKQFGFMGGNYSGREYSSEISLWNDWGWFQLHAMNFLRLREGRFSGTESYVLGGANSVRFMHPNEGVIAKSEILNNLELERVLLHKRPTSFFDVAGYLGLSAVVGGEYVFYEGFSNSTWVARKGGYVGLHVWLPGIEKFRLELGTEWSKVDMVFSLGMFQKRQTQRWRTR